MSHMKTVAVWGVIGVLGAFSFAAVALRRGESVNAVWLVTAAVCVYLIAYRFYSKFIAEKVIGLDDSRQTPAERHRRVMSACGLPPINGGVSNASSIGFVRHSSAPLMGVSFPSASRLASAPSASPYCTTSSMVRRGLGF